MEPAFLKELTRTGKQTIYQYRYFLVFLSCKIFGKPRLKKTVMNKYDKPNFCHDVASNERSWLLFDFTTYTLHVRVKLNWYISLSSSAKQQGP